MARKGVNRSCSCRKGKARKGVVSGNFVRALLVCQEGWIHTYESRWMQPPYDRVSNPVLLVESYPCAGRRVAIPTFQLKHNVSSRTRYRVMDKFLSECLTRKRHPSTRTQTHLTSSVLYKCIPTYARIISKRNNGPRNEENRKQKENETDADKKDDGRRRENETGGKRGG